MNCKEMPAANNKGLTPRCVAEAPIVCFENLEIRINCNYFVRTI